MDPDDPVDYNANEIVVEPAVDLEIEPPQEPLSTAIPGFRGRSTVFIDGLGFVYYQHSIRRNNRYLRCENRRYGCPVTAKMETLDGAAIVISPGSIHNHEPAPRHAVETRLFRNSIRQRGLTENIASHMIVDQQARLYPEAAMNVGHSAAVRSIAWVRHRNSPPVPETLSHWITTFNSEEWGPRLRYINGSMEPFYQGPLEILRDDGTEDLVGIVFTNAAFIRNMQPHLRSIRAICMDGTFQTTPREPADLNQLFTIQIILNNVAIPIVHALLVDRQTETYCRVLQYLRYELRLNISYENLQVITDFEQGLRNAITRVLPETNNTGCWFHYIQSIIRYVRSHQLVNLCRVNENARRILRMLMTLAHLPATEEQHHGNSYSINLGFRVVQDLVTEYNLDNELHDLIRYYERFWIDTVTPARFTVCRLQHRTNNYIESYHASLLRLMGQHPPLYIFYNHLRTIEERARNDFGRAVNGQRVRQANTMNSRNDITIINAWVNVQNGRYDLRDFIQNVAYTPEQLLRHEIGEPNFAHQAILPANNVNMQPLPGPLPLPVIQPLILGPMRPPLPIIPLPIVQPPAVLPPPVRQLIPEIRPLSPGLEPEIRPPSPDLEPVIRPPSPEIVLIEGPQRGPRLNRGRGRRRNVEIARPYHIENRGRGRVRRARGRIANNGRGVRPNMVEAWAEFYQLLDNENEPEPAVPLPVNNRPPPVQNDVVELCIICMDREVVVTLVPCSHKFCNICVAQMMQQNYNICPLCRGRINNYDGFNL